MTARRFRCRTPGCERAIFCERLPAVLTPHARTTGRLTDAHRSIGSALGGEAGPDAVLGRVKAAPLPAYPAPRVLGADGLAVRRGVTYGTIPIDLERRCAIGLLPDRTAEALAEWLRRHPGVRVVSRDRAPAYARAAVPAAPDATQVADRFHLLMNVRGAAERVLARPATLIRDAPRGAEASTGAPAGPPPPTAPRPPSPRQQAVAGRRERRRQRYEGARQMHGEGHSTRAIARALRMSTGPILRYLRTGHVADWRRGGTGPSQLDPRYGSLDRRVGGGGATPGSSTASWVGHTGGHDQVRRAIRRRADRDGRARAGGPIRVRVEVPSARRPSLDVARRPAGRAADASQRVDRPRAAGGVVRAAVDLTEQFAALVRGRSAGALGGWLDRASASGAPEVRGLARSIRRDEAAVRAGLSRPWSNGPVEGRIGRLKVIKRSMFGRAGFDLLKARVLNTS